jgi:hypothetical protein
MEEYHILDRGLSRKSHLVRCWFMTALGQKRTLADVRVMSALPLKADIG